MWFSKTCRLNELFIVCKKTNKFSLSLEFFLFLFEKLSVIYEDFFWPIFWWNLMAFCLSFPKWCNTYTLAEKIKALEHQTFSTHFTSKFMLFWITQKLTFFTHPNIKIAKNGNAPIHWRGFHAFFKNSWPSPPPKISRIVTSFLFIPSKNMVYCRNFKYGINY